MLGLHFAWRQNAVAVAEMPDPSSSRWHGIFTIPVTPFDDGGDLDLDSLRRELDFCLSAGAHGIVHPVMASEWFTLTDEERFRVLPLVADHIAGRVPFVAGVSGVSVQAASRFASAARDAGAAAVIAMPPALARLSPADLLGYYEAISQAAQLPVCIQNAPIAPISPDLVGRLVSDVEHVHYVKEEVEPAHHNIRRRIEAGDAKVWGVFGGAGGQNFIDELARGASGTMPAPHFTDILARIYDLYSEGDQAAARELHTQLMPGLQRERLSGVPFDKEVLVRRGVIRSARTRGAGTPLDAYDLKELDALWPHLEPLFSWRAS